MKEMTETESDTLLRCGLESPYCVDTFGYTPDLSGLSKIVIDADTRADKKRSSAFNIDNFASFFTAYEKAKLKVGLSNREGELPESVLSARKFSDAPTEEEHTRYYIAEKGRYPNGLPVTEREQMEYALPVIEKILDNSDFAAQMLEKIKESIPTNGEKVTIFYPWRFENDGSGNANTNIIPLVFATMLANRLQKAVSSDSELKHLSLNIRAKEIYHRTKNQRKDLTPFQKLAARSFFEIPPADGKAIVIDDDTLSAMSLAEMFHSISKTKAEVIAMGTTSVYDGAERLKLHPKVRDGLIAAIHSNVPDDGEKAVNDLNAVLVKIGYTRGIDSMTNMETMRLITRLYEPEQALATTKALWEEFNSEPLDTVNEKLASLGFPIWEGLLGKEGAGVKRSEHLPVRSCELGKIDFYAGLRGLVDFAQQRGEQLLQTTQKVAR